MPKWNCVGNIDQLKLLLNNLNGLWKRGFNDKLLVEIKLLCKGLIFINFKLTMFGLATTLLLLCTATTTFAFLFLPVERKILKNFTAVMVRDTRTANISGE